MGFQTADLRGVCQELPKLPGVTGVYLLGSPGEREGTIFVSVKGWGEEGHSNRYEVLQALAKYRAAHRFDMEQSGFVFNYHVLLDDPELDEIDIPDRAEPFYAT